MARRVRPHRVIERKLLSDGSQLEIFTKPDRYGCVAFMHVTPTRVQVFNTLLADWLDRYNLSIGENV